MTLKRRDASWIELVVAGAMLGGALTGMALAFVAKLFVVGAALGAFGAGVYLAFRLVLRLGGVEVM